MSQIASVAAGQPAGLAHMGGATRPAAPSGTSENPFSDLMGDAVKDVSRLQDEAQQAVTGLMTGSGVDVHQAMIATEKASMAFELSLAVRNKAVQAYQQVMSMQF
ncbi:MAG TPA: flagellar hook-basal body complex protein FliE [Terracidiphilus sp.]|jgi:flagellar hook-basal body complex protein FliE